MSLVDDTAHVEPVGAGDPVRAWPAPTAHGPVRATVRLPGSKSMTNRALLLAALATGRSRLVNPLVSRDSMMMVAALRELGAEIGTDADCWTVRPAARFTAGRRIDCGLAGTVLRFVPPVAALADGPTSFDGDRQARNRPMAPLVNGLRSLGVAVDGDSVPFTVHGTGRVEGGTVTLDASGSSQFVSGLLLAGPRFDGGVTVRHVGPPLPSRPHLDMTVRMLRDAGVTVDDHAPDIWRVEPGDIAPLELDIEPDLSNAAPFLAAALATGGEVTVPGWPADTTQAGDALRDLLATLGAEVRRRSGALTVRGGAAVHGADLDLHAVGELTPVLVALCALADRPSTVRGVAHLRGHETDRLAALVAELRRLGGEADQTDDGLVITPRPLHGGVVRTYQDHRMAQFAAVLGLVVPDVRIADVATTAKTMPDFPAAWAELAGSPR